MTDGIGKVAVLGGSGFIGHAIVEELIRHGYRVATVNRGKHPCPGRAPSSASWQTERMHPASPGCCRRWMPIASST